MADPDSSPTSKSGFPERGWPGGGRAVAASAKWEGKKGVVGANTAVGSSISEEDLEDPTAVLDEKKVLFFSHSALLLGLRGSQQGYVIFFSPLYRLYHLVKVMTTHGRRKPRCITYTMYKPKKKNFLLPCIVISSTTR